MTRTTTPLILLTVLLLATMTPTALASVSANAGPDRTVDAGQPVTFDGTASSATGESIASYNWDFGDGTTASGSTTTKTYTAAGTYTVTLVVVGTAGGTSVDTASVTARTVDSTAPNITHTPVTSGTANSAITVTANVSDNIGILAATLFYKRSNETTYQSSTMSCTGSATSQACNASIPSSVSDGSAVNYYLRATDTKSGTPNTGYYPAGAPTSNLTITLTDTAAPTITHTAPSSATAGSTLNITATIADNVGVSAATLFYDFNGSTSFTLNSTMTRASGDAQNGTYYATISGATLTNRANVSYYIQANDSANNVARLPAAAPGCFATYACTSTIVGIMSAAAPSVDHTATTSATAGQNLSISATVTPGTGRTITSVMVRYRAYGSTGDFTNVTMTNATGASTLYSGTIPGASVGDLGIEYFVRANDSAAEAVTYPSAGSAAPLRVTTPPSAPTIGTASRASAGVTVTWTAPATSLVDTVSSYNVYRSVDNATFGLLGNATSSATSYLDASALDGVRYYYKVSAVDPASAEGARSSATLTADRGWRPAMPSASASAGSGSVTVNWTGNAAVGGWYLLAYGTTNGTFTQAQNVSVTNASATFTASVSGLTNGQAYVLRLTPYNPYDEASLAPAFLSATPTAPAAPSTGGSGGGGGGGGGGTLPAPATFSLSGLATVPVALTAGESATVSATLANTGGAEGTALVELLVNGTPVASRSYTLAAGASRVVSETFTPTGAGAFAVTLRVGTQSLAAQQVVVSPAPTPATPTPPPTATPTAPTAPTTATPVSTPPTTPTAPTPATAAPPTASPTTAVTPRTTPAAPTPTSTPGGVVTATPTPTSPSPKEDEGGGVPGFEVVALLAAAAVAAFILRRKR